MVACGGGFVRSTGNPRDHDWKEINRHMKTGSDLGLEKNFPKLFWQFKSK